MWRHVKTATKVYEEPNKECGRSPLGSHPGVQPERHNRRQTVTVIAGEADDGGTNKPRFVPLQIASRPFDSKVGIEELTHCARGLTPTARTGDTFED